MANDEFPIPEFELSPGAEEESILQQAMAVPVPEQWAHFGEDNPATLRQLLWQRQIWEREGVSPEEREVMIIGLLHETQRITIKRRQDLAKKEVESVEGTEGANENSAEVVPINLTRAERKERKRKDKIRPRRLIKFGAALMILGRGREGPDRQHEY